VNLRSEEAISPLIDEARFTEVFKYNIPVDKEIDESRFTEKFEYTVSVDKVNEPESHKAK